MMDAQREMTLDEWVGTLPPIHGARNELDQLRRQLAEAEAEISKLRDRTYRDTLAYGKGRSAKCARLTARAEAAESKLALAEQDSRRLDWFTEKIPLITRCGGYWFVSTDATTVEQFDNVRDAIDAAIAAEEGK